jgi:hypothetical protein
MAAPAMLPSSFYICASRSAETYNMPRSPSEPNTEETKEAVIRDDTIAATALALDWSGGHIALGLADDLQPFAAFVRGKTYALWDKRASIGQVYFRRDLDRVLDDPTNWIYVNVTDKNGEAINVWVSAMKGKKGPGPGNFTNYELWAIMQKPYIWDRISFWIRAAIGYRIYKSPTELMGRPVQ